MVKQRMGQVVPFIRSPEALRRSVMKKAGRSTVDAIELTWHLARKEDRAADWLRLAQQLCQAACYEQAAEVLCQLLGRQDAPEDAWLELGRCLNALHDGAAHKYAPEGDVLLPRRGEKLLELALRDREAGREGLAKRRIRRCLHLPGMAQRAYMRLALAYFSQRDLRKALLCAVRAVKADPADFSARLLLIRLLFAAGYRRAAMAGIIRCEKDCSCASDVQACLDTLKMLGAWEEAERFLTRRLALTPYRAVLLRQLAEVAWQRGRRETALQAAQRLLRVDPMDTEALTLCNWYRERPETAPGFGARLLRAAFEVHRPSLMRMSLDTDEPEGFLSAEGENRRALDWCFCRGLPPMQELAALCLTRRSGGEVRRYIRQVLMLPRVYPPVKQRLIGHLESLGDQQPVRVMDQGRILTVDCAARLTQPMKLFPMFLRRFLRETAGLGIKQQAAEFAARLWRLLGERRREDAALVHPGEWTQAAVLLFLHARQHEAFEQTLEKCREQSAWRRIFCRMMTLIRLMNRQRNAGDRSLMQRKRYNHEVCEF